LLTTVEKIKQESRAIARKRRDAACYLPQNLFYLEFRDDSLGADRCFFAMQPVAKTLFRAFIFKIKQESCAIAKMTARCVLYK